MDHWPKPSLIDQYLLNDWVPGLLAAVVVGVALLVVGLRRGKVKLLIAALAAVLIGGLFPLVETLVVTPREQFMQRTVRLARTVIEEPDTAAFWGLLHEDATLTIGGGADPYVSGRDPLAERAERAQRRFEFKGYTVYRLDACVFDEDTAESYLKIGVTIRSKEWDLQMPRVSEWLFRWARSGDRWQVREVRFLTLDNQEAEGRQLP